MHILTYFVGLVLMHAARAQNNETMLWAGVLVSIVSGVAIVLFAP